MSESFELVMEFLDDSPSFAHGFEMGVIWLQLKSNPESQTHIINSENSAQVVLMAEYWKRQFDLKNISDGYLELIIHPSNL